MGCVWVSGLFIIEPRATWVKPSFSGMAVTGNFGYRDGKNPNVRWGPLIVPPQTQMPDNPSIPCPNKVKGAFRTTDFYQR